MLATPYPILAAYAPLLALLGTQSDGGPAIYPHGEAPQNVVPPYVTYFTVVGTPENCLDVLPPIDSSLIQVNAFGVEGDPDSAQTVATAARDAIEPTHEMEAVVGDGIDPDTNRPFVQMQFRFWVNR